MKNIFYNKAEKRVRALWRIVIQFLMWLGFVVTGILLFMAFKFDLPEEKKEMIEMIIELVISIPVLWLTCRWIDKRKFRTIGIDLDKKWWLDFLFGSFVGALLITFIFSTAWIAGWITIEDTFTLDTQYASFGLQFLFQIILFILIAFVEEITYRGYLIKNISEGFSSIVPNNYHVVIAVGISSILFGLMHMNNDNSSMISLFSVFLGGVFLSLSYIWTRSVAIPVGFHFTWNFFQNSVFGFIVSGENLSPAKLIMIKQNGQSIWMGNEFGIESGLLAFFSLLIGIGLIYAWIKKRHKMEHLSELGLFKSPGT